ncbi:MAG: hypothetical protein K0S32_2706 [Bacteroidetes bacterium]|nr:hypothetical protein [Bacteroidota bacterium]
MKEHKIPRVDSVFELRNYELKGKRKILTKIEWFTKSGFVKEVRSVDKKAKTSYHYFLMEIDSSIGHAIYVLDTVLGIKQPFSDTIYIKLGLNEEDSLRLRLKSNNKPYLYSDALYKVFEDTFIDPEIISDSINDLKIKAIPYTYGRKYYVAHKKQNGDWNTTEYMSYSDRFPQICIKRENVRTGYKEFNHYYPEKDIDYNLKGYYLDYKRLYYYLKDGCKVKENQFFYGDYSFDPRDGDFFRRKYLSEKPRFVYRFYSCAGYEEHMSIKNKKVTSHTMSVKTYYNK